MPSYLNKRSINYYIFGLMGVTVVILGILAYYNWLDFSCQPQLFTLF
jgi:cyclic-di-AMP phosphodiesterase